MVELRADCARCAGLCCVALTFARSADFAIDKPAGEACPHLAPGFGCTIHARLRDEGMPGCVAYDCFGAGQHLTQVTFAGVDWRSSPGTAGAMFDAFAIMRQLHELLWYLDEALRLAPARPLHPELRAIRDGIETLTELPAESLMVVDVTATREETGALLGRASDLARAGAVSRAGPDVRKRRGPIDRRGADLAGADLRGADLRGVNLRGAVLIGADLRRADLRLVDLAGADLRGADVSQADLRESLFLTGSQLESMRGDLVTRLSPTRIRPAHWHTPAQGPPAVRAGGN